MSGRRAPGDGTVFYDKAKGRWVAQLPGGTDPDTGRRKRGPKASAATETAARELLRQMAADAAATGVAGRRDTSVAGIVADVLARPPASWRSPITVQVNSGLAGRIVAELGKRKLVSLRPGEVERFLHRMVAEGYSTSTISATKGILRLAIRRAQRDGLVGRNVAELADTPTGTRRESRSMDLGQIRALFASDLTPWWRAYIMTGILTGLRPGELTGLRWRDVDFDAGVIRVRKALRAEPGPDGKNVLVLADLKTERSKRTIALPAKVAEALRAQRASQARDKLRLGRYYQDQDIVFAGNAGQGRWRADANRGFKLACQRAGIGSDWHPHEQRHSFVSVLSDAGVDIEAIADAAGHVNSTVTRTVYRHQIADKVTRASEAMDGIFGKVSGS